MTNSLQTVARATLGLLVIAACSGSPTGTNSGDALSDVEIQALLDALSGSLGGIGAVPTASVRTDQPPTMYQRAEPVNVSINQTVPCESGSMVMDGSVDGDVDQQTLTGSFNVEFTWDFNACMVSTQTTSITVEGDPLIEFKGAFEIGETTFSMSGTEVGGFAFSVADGRSGTCAIDVSFESSVNTSTNAVSGSFSGTVCGVSASVFQTYGGAS